MRDLRGTIRNVALEHFVESHEEKRMSLGTREESGSMRPSILGAKFVKNARSSLRSGSTTSETTAFEETYC